MTSAAVSARRSPCRRSEWRDAISRGTVARALIAPGGAAQGRVAMCRLKRMRLCTAPLPARPHRLGCRSRARKCVARLSEQPAGAQEETSSCGCLECTLCTLRDRRGSRKLAVLWSRVCRFEAQHSGCVLSAAASLSRARGAKPANKQSARFTAQTLLTHSTSPQDRPDFRRESTCRDSNRLLLALPPRRFPRASKPRWACSTTFLASCATG